MVKDAAEGFRQAGGEAQAPIKVRCGHCRALNDEEDKFCGQCGKAL
jgi:rRNA maturation endonuclease Nob1